MSSTDYPFLAVAPGRVNLLGEHVDYNDGPVIPAAINRAVRLRFGPRTDRTVCISALDLQQQVVFSLDELASHQDIHGKPLPDWAGYPAGVAQVFESTGLVLPGMQAEFSSDIPIGAGLSSSAAIEVAFAIAWDALCASHLDRMTLAKITRQAESDYVGVNCGLMDQFASLFGEEQHALYLDTRSLAWRPIPLPAHTALIIADSGVRHSLHQSGYNERRAGCEEAVHILSQNLPGIRALRDVSSTDFNRLASELPLPVQNYARHAVEECERVAAAIPLLENGDSVSFGKMMLACHRSLRDLYQVSTPELDALVEIAHHLPGCYGARLTGAGFGGCTLNLVAEQSALAFIETLKTGYQQATGRDTAIYLFKASQGARVVATP